MGHDEMQKIKHRHTKRIMGMFSTSDKHGNIQEEGVPEKLCAENTLRSPYWKLHLLLLCFSLQFGYGDFHPTSTIRKGMAIFFLPFSVAVFGEVLSRIAGVYMAQKARKVEQAFLHRRLTLRDLQVMDVDKHNKVTYEEVLTFMLVALEKVEKSEVDEIRTIFESLDIDKNGFLEKNDLIKRASMDKATSPFPA